MARIWFSGPRIGPIRPGVIFNAESFRPSARSGASGPGQFVYVIEGSHGAVKIGISVDPPQRRKELQTGTPHHLFLAFSIWGGESAFAVEQSAHAILDAQRMPGEWFAVSKEMAIASVYAAAARMGITLGDVPEQKRRFRVNLAWPWWVIILLFAASFVMKLGEGFAALKN